MRFLSASLGALFVAVLAGRPSVEAVAGVDPVSCDKLASAALPHAQVTRAQLVPAGRFAPSGAGILAEGAPSFKPYSLLPEFCRVAVTLTPSSDSDIKIEVWMPASGWNGRFEGIGNGGWGGMLSVQQLAVALGRGNAVTTSDTGHTGPDGSFAFNHPEKLTDFAYRAVHDMTVQAKALVQAFYGKAPAESYWNGCSTGGRQGLKEAQRYPTDYDGIIAGDPTNDMVHMLTQHIWIAQATLKNPASYIPKDKFAVIHQAVLDACDALDGIKDGVIDDPRRCSFDPKTIQCHGDDEASCLTAAQVDAVRKIYSPAKNPRTGAEIFPGLEPGSELGWTGLASGPKPMSIPDDYFRFIVFKDPAWDFKTLDFDKDIAKAEALDHGDMNATDPDLKTFVARGGKLLMYHGWSDPLVAPRNTVNYYEQVAQKLGGSDKAVDSVRLFMGPGMAHCAGGDGPSNFDPLNVIEAWVEQHKAPDQIIATHLANGAVDRTRPLCPYPQVAAYRGTGDMNAAASFVCTAPAKSK